MTRPDNKTKRKLMRDLQTACFAVVETTLYLDTHPYDKEALNALAEYCEKERLAKEAYESEYGPLTSCACSAQMTDGDRPYFSWAFPPMPWEQEDC